MLSDGKLFNKPLPHSTMWPFHRNATPASDNPARPVGGTRRVRGVDHCLPRASSHTAMNPTPSSSSSTVLTFRHESPAGIGPEQRVINPCCPFTSSVQGSNTLFQNSQTPGPTVPLLQISQTHRPLRFKEKYVVCRTYVWADCQ